VKGEGWAGNEMQLYEIWKRRGMGYEDGLSGGSVWIAAKQNTAQHSTA
jgi:hypothetical protein